MKKIGVLLLAMILLLSLYGCFYQDPVLASLPRYQSEVFYTSGGFQDYTDYAKYTYDELSTEKFENSKYFTETSSEDIEEILLYIDDFEQWVEAVSGELEVNYDFDKNVVTEGDFFCIKTKEGQPIGERTYGKFENYTVYYFDIDTQVMYYFHNNI